MLLSLTKYNMKKTLAIAVRIMIDNRHGNIILWFHRKNISIVDSGQIIIDGIAWVHDTDSATMIFYNATNPNLFSASILAFCSVGGSLVRIKSSGFGFCCDRGVSTFSCFINENIFRPLLYLVYYYQIFM